MSLKILMTTFAILAFALGMRAQDTIIVSKAELLTKAKDKNLQIQIAHKIQQSAEADYLQSRALFLPQVQASYSAMTTTNALNAFGFKLNQENISQADFNPSLLNAPNSVSDFATRLVVQQPIINLDGLYERKAAQVKAEALGLKAARTEEYLIMEISKAYLQLQMAYNVVNVLQQAKATVLSNEVQTQNYFNSGLLQKPDLLAMQVRVTEINNQLQYAVSNVQNASDYIYFLINEPSIGKIFKPAEILQYEPSMEAAPTVLNQERKDIQSYSKSILAYENMLISKKKKLYPRLNAFGSFEFHDKSPLRFRGEGYNLGMQLSWDIFDGYKTYSAIQKSKVELEISQSEKQSYVSQSQLEINKAVRQLQDAANKVILTKQAVEQAKEAYRIRVNRYGQGLEKTSDILNSETMMSQKHLEYQMAVFEYSVTKVYLQFLNP